MSEVYERTSLSLMMADYAVADQLGKLHVVGGNLQVVNRDHNTGNTQAFALVVSLSSPVELFQEQYSFEVVLEETNGTLVELGTTQPGAAPNVVRFGQTLTVEEPNLGRSGAPRRALPAKAHIVLYFNNGLPMPPGRVLVWRAKLDGESRDAWTLPFFVPAAPTGPVLG
ncbi:hypothetical protein EH165_06270 [Nakamurella antarctica]|uniref:Uncharacterized protein n=1 Tax=Nakamurella antarctica TaxID=1902245 RepID=A0A3G8ZKH0_9ACTN|nr:hypothetical protein [Nakamurella antarctica]AZI57812.1 hypothetical protein EH165_06270 [Nakamurella antarctica]